MQVFQFWAFQGLAVLWLYSRVALNLHSELYPLLRPPPRHTLELVEWAQLPVIICSPSNRTARVCWRWLRSRRMVISAARPAAALTVLCSQPQLPEPPALSPRKLAGNLWNQMRVFRAFPHLREVSAWSQCPAGVIELIHASISNVY